ncbi:helix-turn-helix domain-containing protein [Chitinophaga qingshengii]|uniref:AraC family transcriptional regulator n=1 Tax=Chitinophaga qingshengii TaxID=1569794 RepID=A0ABR7TU91_9BACT|nr:helix-turn-helix domain-containing protein [Chitinophaga qingshengii]MBC9933011.1 AraC family transcriptional regulator [Chitinophaga qingshengii]
MEHRPATRHFSSIAALMRYLQLPAPQHPLITLVDYSHMAAAAAPEHGVRISLDFYKISFKQHFRGQIQYGQSHYDFEEGGMAFLKPNQDVTIPDSLESYEGIALYFHPDFIRSSSLVNSISQYGFFSYDVTEALCLSAAEKNTMVNLLVAMTAELSGPIDNFSQVILISQIELLLNYSNRFYQRQFITRKATNHQTVAALDNLLDQYFHAAQGLETGTPSVKYICEQLCISQRYLSDMLRCLTGQNTQQYIQNSMIERSKDLLSSTSLSVAEIAYKLGFEHPQSFNKLFKLKTQLTPLTFRQQFG